MSATAYDRVLDKLTDNGRQVRPTGEGRAKAQCPAHDDGNPSLEVTRAADRVLVNCHAGCDTDEVLAALDLTRAVLFDVPLSNGDRPKIVATYDYRDEVETLLYQKVRYVPKDFRVRRPDGNNGWIWNLKGSSASRKSSAQSPPGRSSTSWKVRRTSSRWSASAP
jgi:putative DNA primase/helicase